MKIFVSSLISGYEGYRAAAVAAIRSLGHEAITAENFGAGTTSPRRRLPRWGPPVRSCHTPPGWLVWRGSECLGYIGYPRRI